MDTALLRLASRDTIGVRVWIVGERGGKHVRITHRPRHYLPPGDHAPWVAAAFNWRMVDYFSGYRTHAAGFWNGHSAFAYAAHHLAPITRASHV